MTHRTTAYRWTGMAVAFLAACTLVLPLGRARAAGTAYVPSGRAAQRWAPTYMAGTVAVTDSEAVAIAQRFDVIAAKRGTFAGQVAAMKAANPRLRLLDYVNAAFAQTGQGTAFPDSWYARDASGAKVQSRNFGNWLMDVSNPEWGATVARQCTSFVAGDPGYDGCFLDMLGTGPLLDNYLTSQPVNPSTGAIWTTADYIRATDTIASGVQAANPDLLVAGNGLGLGRRYFDPTAPTSVLWNSVGAAMPELFVRAAGDSLTKYRPAAAWKSDVSMLADSGSRAKVVLAATKTWVTGSDADKEAWHRYALATFLLGTDGAGYFAFLPDKTWAAITAPSTDEDADIGTASGPYAKVKGTGMYQRRFTNGVVVVNPTTTPYTMALGGTFRSLGGETVTSVTMAPHTGDVLVKG